MRLPLRACTAVLASALWLSAAGLANGPRFYPDDPIARDPESQNAAGVRDIDVSQQYDFVENSFLGAGDRVDKRAVNVNTVDEVPDSSWFTNRIGRAPMTVPELVRGPDTIPGPAGPNWTIVDGKSEGITPGLTIRDAEGRLFFVKFDPPSNPEMASGAEVIATKFFHAVGYHVPENFIAAIRRESLTIDPGATIEDVDGRAKRMRPRDLDRLLEKAAQSKDGAYRVLASKALPGKPVGHFRYYGTRPDDPNDIFPHEHRRELRGLLVFSAWLNHDDSRSINTLDTLVNEGGRTLVRHHLLDFGSTLGSGSTQAQSTRAGNEYIWESRPTFITMLTLGLYVRPWVKVPYHEYPAIGRIEATFFQPQDWKPEYPNPAFENARPEDRFWAARLISKISNEAIAAIVGTAQYSDPQAARYLTDIIQSRRTKVLLAWLNGTNPVVNPALAADGTLTFDNAAEEAVAATAAERYTIQWSSFDNATDTHTPAGAEQTVTERRTRMPEALAGARSEYVAADIRAFHRDHPAWSDPLMVYFRRTPAGWTVVGLERGPVPVEAPTKATRR